MGTIDDEPRSWWRHPIAVASFLILGIASAAWSIHSVWPAAAPQVMDSQQAKEAMAAHHKKEREDWDEMWRKAGKQPPPFQ